MIEPFIISMANTYVQYTLHIVRQVATADFAVEQQSLGALHASGDASAAGEISRRRSNS